MESTVQNNVRPKFQSKQSVIINAPVDKVWDYNQDLSKIPDFHPRVNKVTLISDKQYREAGVSYQCHLFDGKNTCIEKDIEIIPYEKIVTIFISDTMGLTKLLLDYIVESTLRETDDNRTLFEISHYYSDSKWNVWLLNLIIKRKVARDTINTLNAMKKGIENQI